MGDHVHDFLVAARSVLVISAKMHNSAGLNGNIYIAFSIARPDLWALGVESDGNLAARLGSFSGAGVVDDRLVILVRAMGKVHTDNIETGAPEGIDGLNLIRLWTNGADNGSAPVVLVRTLVGVQLAKPLNSASHREMFHGRRSSHCDKM